MTDTLSPASLVPAGTIMPYLGGAQSSPPSGWLFCNGAYLSYETYGDLFAAISYTYGSSGSLFRLPTSGVMFRGSSSIGLGVTAQNHSHNFSFSTSGELVAESGHSHTLNAPVCDPADDSHTHTSSSAQNSGANTTNFGAVSGNANYLAADSHTHAVDQSYSSAGGSHTHTGVVGTVGGGNSHSHQHSQNGTGSSNSTSSLPPVIYIWHIIKT